MEVTYFVLVTYTLGLSYGKEVFQARRELCYRKGVGQTSSALYVSRGKPLQMTCPKGTAGFSRDGDPEDVFWTVNGRSLEELGEKHVRTINGGKTLEVRETRDSDMGAYRCSKGDTPNEDTYLFKVEVMDILPVCDTSTALEVYPDKNNCGRYYRCEHGNMTSSYCKYPNLFAERQARCVHFTLVRCGTRYEPKSPCDYLLPSDQCSGEKPWDERPLGINNFRVQSGLCETYDVIKASTCCLPWCTCFPQCNRRKDGFYKFLYKYGYYFYQCKSGRVARLAYAISELRGTGERSSTSLFLTMFSLYLVHIGG